MCAPRLSQFAKCNLHSAALTVCAYWQKIQGLYVVAVHMRCARLAATIQISGIQQCTAYTRGASSEAGSLSDFIPNPRARLYQRVFRTFHPGFRPRVAKESGSRGGIDDGGI